MLDFFFFLVHTSQLTHLTKARPKSLKRINKRARAATDGDEENEKSNRSFQATAPSKLPKSPASPSKKPPRPPPPKLKSPSKEPTYPSTPATSTEKSEFPSLPSAVSPKLIKAAGVKENSFRLPGLDEVKNSRKTEISGERRPEDDLSTSPIKTKEHAPIIPRDKSDPVGPSTIEKAEKQNDVTIASKHDQRESKPSTKEAAPKSYAENQNDSYNEHSFEEGTKTDRQPLMEEENPQNQNTWRRRGGSMRLNSTTTTTTPNNYRNRNTRRSFSTGRDVKSIRERLESGSNTLRSSLSRFGSTVSLKAQPNKTSKKTPKGEREHLIFEEDPDENTELTVRKKHEEKERAKLAEDKVVPSTPKGKRRLIGGQSVNITSSQKTQPIMPTYKKLQPFDNENVSSDDFQSSIPLTPSFADIRKKEEPTATYKKLSSSPTMQPKIAKVKEKVTPIESKDSDRSEARAITTRNDDRMSKVNVREEGEDDVITENNNITEDEIGNQNKLTEHNSIQPQTAGRFASKQESNTIKGDSLPNYDDNNRQKSSLAPLSRSFTWNSSKTQKKVKSLQSQQRDDDVSENSHVVEGENSSDNKPYLPPQFGRSYSSRQKPRRKLDDQGRLLDSKGCAKRNILSSLSFLGSRKSDSKRMPKDEDEEDHTMKTNAKQSSSWLSKSGLFDSSTQQTTKNKQRNTDDDRQYLIEEDGDDSDEDSCLNRTIQNNNKNNMQAKNKRDKSKKNKLSDMPLKKKYNL